MVMHTRPLFAECGHSLLLRTPCEMRVTLVFFKWLIAAECVDARRTVTFRVAIWRGGAVAHLYVLPMHLAAIPSPQTALIFDFFDKTLGRVAFASGIGVYELHRRGSVWSAFFKPS